MTNKTTMNTPKNLQPCYAIFHGEGGYDNEREKALATFRIGGQYKIIGGSCGRCSTSLEIDGHPGNWNSVMFHYDSQIAPIKNYYAFHQVIHTLEQIYIDATYKTKWQADCAYGSFIRTFKSDDWLVRKSTFLKIRPEEMYEVVKVEARKWKIVPTLGHLAAIQKSL